MLHGLGNKSLGGPDIVVIANAEDHIDASSIACGDINDYPTVDMTVRYDDVPIVTGPKQGAENVDGYDGTAGAGGFNEVADLEGTEDDQHDAR